MGVSFGSKAREISGDSQDRIKTSPQVNLSCHCNQPGQIRPDFPPELNAGQSKTTPKYGSIAAKGKVGGAPMIVVQTLDEMGKITDNYIRLQMQIDTGAELNLCGASWVHMLRLAGTEVSSTDRGWMGPEGRWWIPFHKQWR